MDEKLKGVAASGLALTVGMMFPHLVVAGGGLKLAYDLHAFVRGNAANERVKAATDDLIREVAGLDACEPEEAANRFVAALARCAPEVEELLYDTHRTIFLGKSKAAWPYVVRLTADYIHARNGVPDTFSRRLAWLLERCEDEDVRLLGAVLADCQMRLGEAAEGFHILVSGQALVVKSADKPVKFADGGMFLEGGHHWDAVPSVSRDLLILLRESRLALPGGSLDGCFLPPAVATRLIHVFAHVVHRPPS